jgi:hypothetical protein
MNRKVKAYLYPNPSLDGEILTNIWGDTFEMKNRPFLEVELFNFSSGKYTIEILYPIKLKKNVNITSPCTSVYFFHNEFSNHKLSEVEIVITGKRNKNKFTLPLIVHKISGRVRNFEGKPFPSYLWATKEDDTKFKSIVKTDSRGKFIFYYPEGKKLRLFIDDKSYSKNTFECWIIANTIKSDLKINPRVGDFELYDLQVWFTVGLCYAFFVPASLPLSKREKKFEWKQRFPPQLTKEDHIMVLINNKKAEIKDIIELPTHGKVYYPSYVVVAKPRQKKFTSPTIVNVEVNSPEKGRGEAWYVYY